MDEWRIKKYTEEHLRKELEVANEERVGTGHQTGLRISSCLK
jgi:hypothetical protein